jgi:hypothetical protein
MLMTEERMTPGIVDSLELKMPPRISDYDVRIPWPYPGTRLMIALTGMQTAD